MNKDDLWRLLLEKSGSDNPYENLRDQRWNAQNYVRPMDGSGRGMADHTATSDKSVTVDGYSNNHYPAALMPVVDNNLWLMIKDKLKSEKNDPYEADRRN